MKDSYQDIEHQEALIRSFLYHTFYIIYIILKPESNNKDIYDIISLMQSKI